MTERNPSAIQERTYQRRRLGVLAAVLLVVLGLAPLLDRPDAGPVEVATAADPAAARVRIAGVGSPTAVRELLSDTTTTLVEASGATTSTTTAPPTTAAPAPTTTAPADDEAPAPTTTSRAVEVVDEEPAEPTTTTAAPATTSPPTTAAPRPTTTTTTSPPPATSTSEGYADDDPRGTQVWYDLADCESGGNWSIDTGNGYYGGLQFSLATWESVGGTGYPHEHPVATQIEMGRRLQARQGWGAWPHCSEELGLR